MENLNLIKKVRFPAPNPSKTFTINCDIGSLIIEGGGLLHVFNTQSVKAAPTPLNLDNLNNKLISIQHLPEIDSICCIFSNAKATLYDVTSQSYEQHHLQNAKELVTAQWSPDQTILAIVDSSVTNCHLLTKEFEKIVTIPLQTEASGRDSNVNVGWGSRSTQFQGKAGKSNRETELPSEYTADKTDNRDKQICWRPDGQYLAISYFLEGTRQVRIFTRDGTYLAKSEPLPGLTGVLSWSTDLQLITAVQIKKSPPGIFIVFLEKNGLKHGEFQLSQTANTGPDDSNFYENLIITDLIWSTDNYLTIAIYNKKYNTSRIEIWKRYVYQWYKKFSDGDFEGSINSIQFDPTESNTLHVLLSDSHFVKYQFSKEICRLGSSLAICNGNKILLTDFSCSRPPPPMCQKEISLENYLSSSYSMPVNIDFNRQNKHMLATLNNSNIISVFDISKLTNGRQNAPKPLYQIVVENKYKPLQIYFLQNDLLMVRCNRPCNLNSNSEYDGINEYDGFGHAVLKYDFRSKNYTDYSNSHDLFTPAEYYWSYYWHPISTMCVNDRNAICQTVNQGAIYTCLAPIDQNIPSSNDRSSVTSEHWVRVIEIYFTAIGSICYTHKSVHTMS